MSFGAIENGVLSHEMFCYGVKKCKPNVDVNVRRENEGVSDTQVTVMACWPLVNLGVARTHNSGLYFSTVCC